MGFSIFVIVTVALCMSTVTQGVGHLSPHSSRQEPEYDDETFPDQASIEELAAPSAIVPSLPIGFTITTIATGLGTGTFIGLAADQFNVNPLVYYFDGSSRLFSVSDAGVRIQIGPVGGYSGTIGSLGIGQPFPPRFGPDGRLYVNGASNRVYAIDVTTGASAIYGQSICSSCRYGMDFDAGGNLIFMQESIPPVFFRINPHPTGATAPTFLGSAAAQPNSNHGDAFAVQPGTGDYIVFSDNCGPQATMAFIAAGHVDGAAFVNRWIGATFTFPQLCQQSIGSIQPLVGDVFTVPGAVGAQTNIGFTPASGSTPASDAFLTTAVGGIYGIAFKGCSAMYIYTAPNGGQLQKITGFSNCPLATE